MRNSWAKVERGYCRERVCKLEKQCKTQACKNSSHRIFFRYDAKHKRMLHGLIDALSKVGQAEKS